MKERINWIWQELGICDFRSQLFNILEWGLVLFLVAEIFYDSLLMAIPLIPILIPLSKIKKRRLSEKRKQELTVEFKECTDSILTALKAGSSAENAFRDSIQEMAFLYGERCEICQELRQIAHGLDSNIPLEKLLLEFAERSEVEEIEDFAEIFSIAKRNGGNMTEILERTIIQIQTRIQTKEEIHVLISNGRLEQSIMDIVPFAIIVYVRITSEGFLDVLYHNPAGIGIMTVCLIVYLIALVLSEKIIAIQV